MNSSKDTVHSALGATSFPFPLAVRNRVMRTLTPLKVVWPSCQILETRYFLNCGNTSLWKGERSCTRFGSLRLALCVTVHPYITSRLGSAGSTDLDKLLLALTRMMFDSRPCNPPK
jgi:hypothetical protein